MAERNEKGQFTKGHTKTGGKQKGYESPIKKELRELLGDFTISSFEDFMAAWGKCEPKDKCTIWLNAAKFNIPMLQSVALDSTKELTNDITEKLRLLSKDD